MFFGHRDRQVIVFDTVNDLKIYFRFEKNFVIIEDDLGVVSNLTEINNRRALDAEILSLFAANVEPGNMLDIGTYFGRSAARMAANSPTSKIHTVNVIKENFFKAGKLTTGCLDNDEIGSYYRNKGIKNVFQVYANSLNWVPGDEVSDLSLVYIDGGHDKETVFSDTKLAVDRIKRGAYVLWHDYSPLCRENFQWIDEVMRGVEKAVKKRIINGPIFNVRNSWIGIWKNE